MVVVVVVVVDGGGVAGSGSGGGFRVRRVRGGVKRKGRVLWTAPVYRRPPKGCEREKERNLTE